MASLRDSDRRRATAVFFIVLLTGAEARRIGSELVLSGSEKNLNVDTQGDLESRMVWMNTTLAEIRDGSRGLFGSKLCLTTCPYSWTKMAYNNWEAKKDGEALVAKAFGGSGDIARLSTINAELGMTFSGTMRQTAWTFLQALDNSMFQRTMLTLTLAPLAAFRSMVGISPLGLCFFKAVWADMEAHSSYRQKNTKWWNFMLAGCPEEATGSPWVFEDTASISKSLNGMVYALGKSNDLTTDSDEEAAAQRWQGSRNLLQCVKKKTRSGKWTTRLLQIKEGIVSWEADSECESGFFDRAKDMFKKKRSFALQFVTVKPGQDPVELTSRGGVPDKCIALQNPYRKFEFCAMREGEDMVGAKEVIEQHFELLKDERELMATTAKLERLLAASGSDNKELKSEEDKVKEDMDETGDSSVEDLISKIDTGAHTTGDSAEEQEAEKILNQIRRGTALMQSEGADMDHVVALLQEAFDSAHSNSNLTAVMKGRRGTTQKSTALVEVGSGNPAASGAGTVTMVELLIILLICGGGFLCLYVGLSIAASNVETSAAVEFVKSNTTEASTFKHFKQEAEITTFPEPRK